MQLILVADEAALDASGEGSAALRAVLRRPVTPDDASVATAAPSVDAWGAWQEREVSPSLGAAEAPHDASLGGGPAGAGYDDGALPLDTAARRHAAVAARPEDAPWAAARGDLAAAVDACVAQMRECVSRVLAHALVGQVRGDARVAGPRAHGRRARGR